MSDNLPSEPATVTPQSATAGHSPRLLGRMIVAQGALNVALGPALLGLRHVGGDSSGWLGMAWMAAVAAQLALISAWLCWSRAPLRTRLLRFAGLWCGVVGTVLLAAIVAAPNMSVGSDDMQLTGIILFLTSVAIQFPLWLLRFAGRLRIDTPASLANPPTARQMSIADLLALTAAVATLLAIGRFLPKPDEPYFWPIALTIMGIIAAASLLTVPVAAWLMSGRYSSLIAICLTIAYLSTVAISSVLIFSAFTGDHLVAGDLAYFLVVIAGYVATLATFLAAARLVGWRLVSGWRRGS